MIATIVALAFSISLALATLAWAECAWVLWQQTRTFGPPARDNWDIREVFETKEACERAKGATSSYGSTGIRDTCYPDTIDPRGPKGGGR
jgi:hypothetical protein